MVAPYRAYSSREPANGCDNRGMDPLDREILGELVRDARLSYRDLGARVGLAPTPPPTASGASAATA